MSALTTQSGSQYTDEDRRRVIASYAVYGNQTKVAKIEGMPRITVQQWVTSEWGQELLNKIRHETQDEMIASYSSMVRANLKAQNDRLLHGDVVGYDDEGNELRQAVRYRDLVVGAGVGVDKIRLLSNQATTITANDSTLTKISEQLAAYARDQQTKTIDGHAVCHTDKLSD